MKKILLGLVIIAYSISCFIFNKYFEVNEIINMISSNKFSINVTEWQKDEKVENKLEKIEELSRKEKINISKIVYKPLGESNQQKIILYTAVGDQKQLSEQVPLKSGVLIKSGNAAQLYLSSKNERDEKQIGRIGLFSSSNVLEIKPIEAAKNENVRGTYLVDSQNPKVINTVKENMTTDLGFKIEDQPPLSMMKTLTKQKIMVYLFIVLIIVLILISLSFLYYILLNFKELAVRKLFGFTDRELIFKVLMKENVKIHLLSLGLVFIGHSIFLYFYNGMSQYVEFMGQWIIWQLIFTCASLVLGIIPLFMVVYINISEMLKNRKPLKLVQFLNYGSKLIFSLLLVILFVNVFHQYQEFSAQSGNREKWKTTKNYNFYEYQDTHDNDKETWEYTTGKKSQALFEKASRSGGLLVKPSDGIVFRDIIAKSNNRDPDLKPYDPQEGNTLQVNANYLNENPVYDDKGKKIDIKDSYGDYLIVLVPEQYRYQESDVSKAYTEWYQFKRFVDEDMHNKKMGKKTKPNKNVQVKLVYIKDGQKHFLYDPMLEKENQNYVKNATIMVINSKNIGGDSYFNYLSGHYFFPYAKSTENAYGELSKDIQLVGLEKTILTAPSLYSVVDDYLFNLENELKINFFVAVVLLIIGIVITIFSILNYLERNKLVHAVKKIHGFSSFERHKVFSAILVLFWVVICAGVFVTGLSSASVVFTIFVVCLSFELITIYLIINGMEAKRTKEVLKGA